MARKGRIEFPESVTFSIAVIDASLIVRNEF
jgi:hypothetical protein